MPKDVHIIIFNSDKLEITSPYKNKGLGKWWCLHIEYLAEIKNDGPEEFK